MPLLLKNIMQHPLMLIGLKNGNTPRFLDIIFDTARNLIRGRLQPPAMVSIFNALISEIARILKSRGELPQNGAVGNPVDNFMANGAGRPQNQMTTTGTSRVPYILQTPPQNVPISSNLVCYPQHQQPFTSTHAGPQTTLTGVPSAIPYNPNTTELAFHQIQPFINQFHPSNQFNNPQQQQQQPLNDDHPPLYFQRQPLPQEEWYLSQFTKEGPADNLNLGRGPPRPRGDFRFTY
jgi:hypothetical protein